MTETKHNRYWRKKREFAISLLGDSCFACGFDDLRALHIDHLTPVLRQSRPDTKHKDSAAEIIAVHKSGEDVKNHFQLLCANCHWIRTYHEEKQHLLRYDATDALAEKMQLELFQ